MNNIVNNNQQLFEGLSSILPLISVICTWKIFADRGEAGWKALVPFYSFLVFGRVAGDEKKGKNLVIASILAIVFGVVFFVSLTLVLSGLGSESVAGIALLISLILMAVATIYAGVMGILLKVEFVKNEGDAGWIAVLWVLLPIAGDVYYAFLKH